VQDSIQQVQKFWDQRPCNLRHSSQEVGTRLYFDEVDSRRYLVEPHILNFADFDKYQGLRVLELGCGIGTDAIRFAKAGAIYSGIELSAHSLSLAKQRFEIYGFEGQFILGNVENFSEIFSKGEFDLIYSFGVLHHTPSIRNALNSIASVATKDTEIKIMVYATNSWKSAMIEAGLDQPEAQFGCPIANTYTKEEISQLFVDSGLAIKSIHQDHVFPYIIEDYLNYKYTMHPYFESMPPAVFAAVKARFGWHCLIQGNGL